MRREEMTWSGLVDERKEIDFSQGVAFHQHHHVHVPNLFTPSFLPLQSSEAADSTEHL